jgi:hypothetical protein
LDGSSANLRAIVLEEIKIHGVSARVSAEQLIAMRGFGLTQIEREQGGRGEHTLLGRAEQKRPELQMKLHAREDQGYRGKQQQVQKREQEDFCGKGEARFHVSTDAPGLSSM